MNHNDRKICWVGVSFDPDDAETEYIAAQHEHIVDYVCTLKIRGADETNETLARYGNTVGMIDRYHLPKVVRAVEIYDSSDSRVGFGIEVRSVGAGNERLPGARTWLRGISITMHVAVYEWDPFATPSTPPRPAGVDEMLSTDCC